ncbi:MAG: DNA alkylation repair protein, partial [Planctomycetes bacterium]|nr:DNA alkylation repair protein [Planctomycetota bacterium]
MAEPFKNMIGPALVGHLGRHLTRVWPRFRREAFRRRALRGLDALELKARVAQVAGALEEFLPADFAAAADVLEATLAPPRTDADLSALVPGDHGLAGAPIWPMTDFVARCGLVDPERALQALHAMTQRHTAEFAIRPFLREHPAQAWAALRRWVNDPSPHVRRLVSEGSRPRLPWGEVLQALIVDPSPTLPLLEQLQDDPSDYVRRSVANHLNDIAKDHPEVVADWIARHVGGADKQRLALLQRAGRTLIKRGHRGVLGAFGCGAALRGDASLTIAPA